MLTILFEHHHGEYPDHREGPFEWIEMIGGNMFGLRPGCDEAEEIAGVNEDGSWDAGDLGGDNWKRLSDPRVRRRYSRWTISEARAS